MLDFAKDQAGVYHEKVRWKFGIYSEKLNIGCDNIHGLVIE